METGNDILERMLKCFDIIDNLSVEEKQALADEYWNFADRRNADRNAHQGGAEIDTKTWEGLSVKYPLEAVQTQRQQKLQLLVH